MKHRILLLNLSVSLILLTAFVFLFSTTQTFAEGSCMPNGIHLFDSFEPCPVLRKEGRWLINWPDGHESSLTIRGSGSCMSGTVLDTVAK